MPFIGRKNGTLTARQQSYNDVHDLYRARIEHLFGQLWHWGWLGISSVAALMSRTSPCVFCCISGNFAFRGMHSEAGPSPSLWTTGPVWTNKSNSGAVQDEREDEADVCALCCQKRSTITACGECQEHYCDECIDAHTCGEQLV